MAEELGIALNPEELRVVKKLFKHMDDVANAEAKSIAGGLATYLQGKIQNRADARPDKAATRIAKGSKVSKSDKLGTIVYGYQNQKFSGGGNTQQLWGGYEFGSIKFTNFPRWSGRNPSGGAGSRGWFIFPTLRAEQPHIVDEWRDSFSKIVKEW
jgi:hypothetical protein